MRDILEALLPYSLKRTIQIEHFHSKVRQESSLQAYMDRQIKVCFDPPPPHSLSNFAEKLGNISCSSGGTFFVGETK